MELKPASINISIPENVERTYSKEEIELELAALRKLRQEISNLREVENKSKDKLQEMIVCADIPPREMRTFVFNSYWYCEAEINANSLRSLVEMKLGKEQWPDMIMAITECTCSLCGQVVTVEFKSRVAFNNGKRYLSDFVCDTCKENRKRQTTETRASRQQSEQNRIQELRSMSYTEYLQTLEWENTRKQALKRAKYKCQLCNAHNVVLHVHHTTYEHLGQEFNNELIVLCEACHAKFHNKDEK